MNPSSSSSSHLRSCKDAKQDGFSHRYPVNDIQLQELPRPLQLSSEEYTVVLCTDNLFGDQVSDSSKGRLWEGEECDNALFARKWSVCTVMASVKEVETLIYLKITVLN